MSKITKKQLLKRLEALEEWSNWADNMLDELNHALPDPEYDAKCEAEAVDVDASLARHHARLGLTKPKLKDLDQSVFDGQDEKWRFAATDRNNKAFLFSRKPTANNTEWYAESIADYEIIGTGYDASNWKNSLIERESKELTGSDLCRAMLERGDKFVMCYFSDDSDRVAAIGAVEGVCVGWCAEFRTYKTEWEYAVPINNMGEPLTAKEVGL